MGENRNIAVCIILTIITCGIYGLYWFVKLTDETNSMAPEKQSAGGVHALIYTILTCGIYGIYWAYKLGEKVDVIKESSDDSPVLFLVLHILGLPIIDYCLAQDAINKKCA